VSLEQYSPAYGLLEEACKSWEHGISDKVIYLLQPVESTHNALMGIAKSYINGSSWIESHLTFEIEGNTHHACLLIMANKVSECSREIGEAKIRNRAIRGDSAMLVNNAEQVQSPQQMAVDCCGVLSSIWLKRFDDINCICGYTPRFSGDVSVIGNVNNREFGLCGITPNLLGQSPNELIQGRPETIQALPQNEGNDVRTVFDMKVDDIPLIFNVILFDNSYRLRFLPPTAKPLPDVIKVFLRPEGLEYGVSHGARHESSIAEPLVDFGITVY
jgi:hypothetical protein